MKEGGSVGGNEARCLKPENLWNENISFVKREIKRDQAYGCFGAHQSAIYIWNPVVKFSWKTCCVCPIWDNTATHTVLYPIYSRESLSPVNQAWRSSKCPSTGRAAPAEAIYIVMSAPGQYVCFWTLLKGLFVELYNPAQTPDYFFFSVGL